MIDRNTSTRGLLNACFPFTSRRQFPLAFCSLMPPTHSSAVRTLSSRFFGSGEVKFACAASNSSSCEILARAPGTVAICSASASSDIDFRCGFQLSFVREQAIQHPFRDRHFLAEFLQHRFHHLCHFLILAIP